MVADVRTSVIYQTLSEADAWQHLPDGLLSLLEHLRLVSADAT